MDEKTTPSLRGIADRILGHFASLRASMRDRIREVDRMSQREVMGAAQDVNAIYTSATTQIAELKSRLSSASMGDAHAGSVSAEGQLLAVEHYVNNLDERINALKSIAGESAGCTEQIEQATQQIQKLTTNAHMLAINARIEAARGSDGSANGFAVIAVEMKDLSRAIAATSDTVKMLAQSLGNLLPQLDSGISGLRQNSQEFSNSLAVDIRTLAQRDAIRKRDVDAALAASDVTLGAIVRASQSALSHLQFQDAIAQGLMRMDATAHEAEVAACKDLGAEDRIAKVVPAMHVELGGEKTVDHKNAGEVMLL